SLDPWRGRLPLAIYSYQRSKTILREHRQDTRGDRGARLRNESCSRRRKGEWVTVGGMEGATSFLRIGSIRSMGTFIVLSLLGSVSSPTGGQHQTAHLLSIRLLVHISTHHLDSSHHFCRVHASECRHIRVHCSIGSQLVGVLHNILVRPLECESLSGHSICLALLHFL
ncbi:hypothetical protein PMAYCL1PPCAC_23315, partial [Pristionchus mayeri]